MHMNKPNDETSRTEDELHDHYDLDFSKAKPNRFAEQLTDTAMIVEIEPDVAAAFHTPEAVNEALRLIMKLAAIPSVKPHQSRRRRAKAS